MHLVFELEAAEHLPRVLLEVTQLVDDLGLVGTLAANPVKLVVEAQILESGKELGLLALCRRLVNYQVDELEGDGAEHGLVRHRERQDKLIERCLVVLVSLVGCRLRDEVEGIGALRQTLNDLTEAPAGYGAQLGVLVVHVLVESCEEVKLALDVLAGGLELEEMRHDLEYLLDDLGLQAPQAVL